MTEKRSTATYKVLHHVHGAVEALERLVQEGTAGEGVLSNPPVQGASLKIAAEEIGKALAVFERIKWK